MSAVWLIYLSIVQWLVLRSNSLASRSDVPFLCVLIHYDNILSEFIIEINLLARMLFSDN